MVATLPHGFAEKHGIERFSNSFAEYFPTFLCGGKGGELENSPIFPVV